MPELKAVGEGFALVGAGKVDDRGGAAPDGSPGAGLEVVGGGGVGHVQVEVGVGVEKAGEEQLPGDVHHRGVGAGEGGRDGGDQLVLHQHVHAVYPRSGDHVAALEEQFHGDGSFLLDSPIVPHF